MARSEASHNGVLPVNKPTGPTSHDVIHRVRRILGQRRVGHTGTLDPLASGLMLVCLGRATKLARFMSDFDKTYVATVELGRTSETYDAERVDLSRPAADVSGIERLQVEQVLAEFVGVIRQRVPAFSAVRVDGRRLYKAARRGERAELPERETEISKITLLRFERPAVEFEVTCSKGTYVRTLADDIGRRLGCGAYLAALKRSRVGNVTLESALTPDEVEKYYTDQKLAGHILPVDRVLNFGAIKVSDEFAEQVTTGRLPGADDVLDTQGAFNMGDRVFLKDTAGRVLAVGTAAVSSSAIKSGGQSDLFKYLRVLS